MMFCHDHMGQDLEECCICSLIADHKAEIARLTAELDNERQHHVNTESLWNVDRGLIEELRRELAEALASAAAAYERAARVAHNRESHAKGETARACRGIAVSIGMLATEAETSALAEMLDAETRACAEVCNVNDQVSGWVSRDAILARIDQRKEGV